MGSKNRGVVPYKALKQKFKISYHFEGFKGTMDTDLASIWRPEVYQIWRNLALCWIFPKKSLFYFFQSQIYRLYTWDCLLQGKPARPFCFRGLFKRDLRGRAAPTFKQGNNRFEVSTIIFQKNHWNGNLSQLYILFYFLSLMTSITE